LYSHASFPYGILADGAFSLLQGGGEALAAGEL